MCDVIFKQLFIMLRSPGFRVDFQFGLASLLSSSEQYADKQRYLLVSTFADTEWNTSIGQVSRLDMSIA